MLKFLQSIFRRDQSNSDHKAVLDSIGTALKTAGDDADLMKKELSIVDSEGEWLDEWGTWFGVSRLSDYEEDNRYLDRMLSVIEDKVTIPAIINGVKKVLGDNTIIKIYEPYHEIRYFNVSTFSGEGRYQDGDYYRIGVIDVIINKPVTDELVKFINLIKGAGVSVKFTYKPTPPIEDVIIDGSEDEEIVDSIVSMEMYSVEEQEGRTQSGSNPEHILSGEQVIWTDVRKEDY
jgi:hypothetical protein